MSGFFQFLSPIAMLANLFSGGGGGQQQQQPLLPPSPTPAPVPPPPDRSDETVMGMADIQRRRYGVAGGRTVNALTGGLGVPSGSTVSTVASLLGSVGR